MILYSGSYYRGVGGGCVARSGCRREELSIESSLVDTHGRPFFALLPCFHVIYLLYIWLCVGFLLLIFRDGGRFVRNRIQSFIHLRDCGSFRVKRQKYRDIKPPTYV